MYIRLFDLIILVTTVCTYIYVHMSHEINLQITLNNNRHHNTITSMSSLRDSNTNIVIGVKLWNYYSRISQKSRRRRCNFDRRNRVIKNSLEFFTDVWSILYRVVCGIAYRVNGLHGFAGTFASFSSISWNFSRLFAITVTEFLWYSTVVSKCK